MDAFLEEDGFNEYVKEQEEAKKKAEENVAEHAFKSFEDDTTVYKQDDSPDDAMEGTIHM